VLLRATIFDKKIREDMRGETRGGE